MDLLNPEKIRILIASTDAYNFHSHTQYCDGRATMAEMAAAAASQGMKLYGFSPHSPVCIESPCNMDAAKVSEYLDEADRLRDVFARQGVRLFAGMEIDRLNHDWGPHIDYFRNLPLDYRIGAVHFVTNQDGIPIDCDGSYERFARNLKDGFDGDLRYVVEKYFESLLLMLEEGRFDILAHADKIAANAAQADPRIESQGWYEALIDDVVAHAADAHVAVEINTKSLETHGRFFPALKWWPKFIATGLPMPVDSDAHYPDKINLNRSEALDLLLQALFDSPQPSTPDYHNLNS